MRRIRETIRTARSWEGKATKEGLGGDTTRNQTIVVGRGGKKEKESRSTDVAKDPGQGGAGYQKDEEGRNCRFTH